VFSLSRVPQWPIVERHLDELESLLDAWNGARSGRRSLAWLAALGDVPLHALQRGRLSAGGNW
jgi:hypothetical protein